MSIIQSVQNISGQPMNSSVSEGVVFPPRTYHIRLDKIYKKVDARDVREYLEKSYPNIFDLENGLIVLSGRNLVVTFSATANMQNVRDKAEELFSKPLKDIRKAIGKKL